MEKKKRITSYREITVSYRFSKDFTDEEIKEYLKFDFSDFKNHSKNIEKIAKNNTREKDYSFYLDFNFDTARKNRFRTIVYIEKSPK